MKKTDKISNALIKNHFEGKISDQAYKKTLKSPQKMHIDKSGK